MKITVKDQMPTEWYAVREEALADYLKGEAAKMEKWAKENASSPQGTKEHIQEGGRTKWIDQTRIARDSLTGGFEKTDKGFLIYIGQGVKYGKALEEANDGAYAICGPTLKHHIPEIKAMIKRIFQ
ncbi:hypothetical protein [Leadbettera azotonutricia]|uniref:Uncharacterized protein n=1 Tax=Leadbettera azotonutricia (strain ATCC BAA-888 / DSM 13862 / ZAS-9) TaxID=545695 RepID=F5YF66_LEAAZ|nr:hypothetical protein [Leadbettera azotonutricia]AEF82591.1 hypothetical protein TREAZ_2497 [Leadbettera azotonutricia ZAS-9]